MVMKWKYIEDSTHENKYTTALMTTIMFEDVPQLIICLHISNLIGFNDTALVSFSMGFSSLIFKFSDFCFHAKHFDILSSICKKVRDVIFGKTSYSLQHSSQDETDDHLHIDISREVNINLSEISSREWGIFLFIMLPVAISIPIVLCVFLFIYFQGY
jgi:hypothetical protein